MKHEELDRSSILAACFRPRQEEPSMLSANEVNILLEQHQTAIDYQTQLRGSNKRTIRFRVGIISFGAAAAVALATYLFLFVGAPQTTRVRHEISSLSPLAKNAMRPSGNEVGLPIEKRIASRVVSSTNQLRIRTNSDENTPGASPASRRDMDALFCLSVPPYRVDTASLLVPRKLALVVNPAVRSIPENRRRLTYQRESDANNDLLGSIYNIGYLTLADPVISAYDTVKSVSERTLATLNIVRHP